MRRSLPTLLLSVVLVGCASEEGLQRYARGKAIEPKIVALGLPEITDKRVRVIPIGQLINDKSAVFLDAEGRRQRLKEDGYITGTVCKVDAVKIGLTVQAFIGPNGRPHERNPRIVSQADQNAARDYRRVDHDRRR